MKKGPASLRKISVVTGAVRALVGAGTLLVAFANTGHSATIQATGVSGIEVQAAIDLAREGDTVRVPAGAASWTAQVNILNKGIKLIGAGIGNTVITRAVPGQGDNALYVRGYATNFVLIQGFTWNTVSVAQYGQVCVESRIHTDPACQVRVTQCRFEISPA